MDTTDTPQIAVIILNWNGQRFLEEYLPEVIRTTDPALGRVIVADNASTDGSQELMAERFPQVELIKFDRNYGFAEGYNRAIAAVDAPWVVLLNSDVRTGENWLAPLWEYVTSNSDVAAVQPKILSIKNPDTFEYAGAAGGFIDTNGYPYCRGRIFDTCEKDNGQYDTPADIFWATGAALMVRRDIYLSTGGLDKEFFAHMEEIDLCWRIRLAGYRIAAVPASTVYHLGGGSLPAENPRKTYLNFRNNLLMMHKNLPDGIRGRKLLVRRLLDTVAFFRFILGFDFPNARAVIRAHNDFRRMAPSYTAHPAVSLLPQSPNILVQYFLRGRKTFGSLK